MFGIHLPHLPFPYYSTEGAGAGGGDKQQQQGNASLMGQEQNKDEGGGGEAPKVFPDNWRDLLSGEDPVLKTEAARYKEPGELLRSLVETKKMVRGGKDDPMPDVGDGKDEAKNEQLKAWRQRHGIPDDPTGYKLPEDVTKRLLDSDKPLLENFTQFAHKAGQPQAVVDFATKWYVDAMEQEAVREAEQDKKDASSAEDVLRSEWEQGYKGNFQFAVDTAKNILGEAYGGASIFDARLPNGMKLGSIPEFVKGMHQVGLAIFGDGTLVGDEARKGMESRKNEIREVIRTTPEKYYGTPLEKEYMDILAAEEKAASAPGRR